jgi:chromosome segregation ATPase
VASHSGETHRHLQELAARLADAGRELHDDDAPGELLRAVQAGLAELATRRAQLEAELMARAQASASLGAFRAALGQARQEWHRRQDEVTEELARAEEAARGQTRAYVSGIEGPFNDAIDALVAELPHDLLIEPHNQAVAGLMQKLTEEAKGQLGDALGPVRQAMEDLGRTCRAEQDRLQQGTGEILKKAEAALQRLEKMRPAWALAHRLG